MGDELPSDEDKEDIASIRKYAESLVELIEKPSVGDADLAGINDKVSEFFNLISKIDLQLLNQSELSQLNLIVTSFNKAITKRSKKTRITARKANMATQVIKNEKERGLPDQQSVSVALKEAEENWNNILRRSGEGSETATPFTLKNKRSFVDAEGVTRNLYEVELQSGKKLSIVFYPKNTLPYNEEVAKGEVLLFGTEPTSRSKEAWDTFVSSLRKTSSGFREEAANLAESSKDVVAFVEVDPFQIARLAKALGSKSEFVDNIVKWGESKDWRIGKEENRAIDALIAGTIIDEEGNLSSKRNADGAYLMLKWMLGDRDAERILQSKVERLNEIINRWAMEKAMHNKIVDLNTAHLLDVGPGTFIDKCAWTAAFLVKALLEELGMKDIDPERVELSKIRSDLQSLQEESDQKLLDLQKAQVYLDGARAQLTKSGTEAGAAGHSWIGSLLSSLSGKAAKEENERKKIKYEIIEKQSKVSIEIDRLNSKKALLKEALKYLDALASIKYWEKMIRAVAPEGKINPFDRKNGYSIARSLINDEEAVNRLARAIATVHPHLYPYDQDHQTVGSIGELVAVHVTQFMPAEGLTGEMVIPSLFDATRSKVPRTSMITSEFTKRFEEDERKGKIVPCRNTVHFALNDTVKPGPLTGDWDKMLIAVVAPLNDLIKLNGKPVSVLFGDTFFRTSPGEGLKLPDSTTIVRPPLTDSEKQAVTGEKSFMSQGNTVIYNPEKISLEAVVDYVIKSKGYKKIPFKNKLPDYPADIEISNLLIGVELGATCEIDASLLNQRIITRFSIDKLTKLSSGEISMAAFESERDRVLKLIFDRSNDPMSEEGSPSWYEFRTLYLAGIL